MKMTLMEHFAEFRRRLLWCVVFLAAAFGIGWFVAPYVLKFMVMPLESSAPGTTMLFTGIADGLLIQFSIAGLVALCLTVPFVLWHTWAFVSPALKKNEKKIAAYIIITSPLLFAFGALFAYFIMFPLVFGFLAESAKSYGITSVFMPDVKNYIAFSVEIMKAFGICFQMPLVLVILNRIGILPRAVAAKFRRYAIVIIFAVAAILTPPDVMSQIILAVPMVLLFEISLLLMKKDTV